MQKSSLSKLNMPDKPGVYFFLGGKKSDVGRRDPQTSNVRQEKILYIGKATSLKDRVRSYFSPDLIETRGAHIVDMVFKADDIKWTETDSVLEALILEANLIKKHQPYYNTKEKDDKSFNFVCVTKEYKIRIIRGKDLNQTKEKFKNIYGPFPKGGELKEALRIIRKFFPYIEDRKGAKGKEEFYKQIKLLPEDSAQNKKNINNICLFFEGKKKKIIQIFTKEMKSLAKEKRFEEAGEIKRKIFALNHINDIALIKEDLSMGGERLDPEGSKGQASNSRTRIEAYDIAHMSGKNMVGVMVVLENGELNKNEYRKFKIQTQKDANDTGALKEVLERRFKHKEWNTPQIIVVDGSTSQINVALEVMSRFNLDIKVVAVTKDDKHKAKELKGEEVLISKYKKQIVLINAEAHRFAIGYHKQMRSKNFLNK